MREPTFELHFTEQQIRVLCEGMKMVQRNSASSSEAATAERINLYCLKILDNAGSNLTAVDK